MPNRLNTIFLIITILIGSFILYPNLDYQKFLSQGDHGRDLYSYLITMEGNRPYKDFWSQYGPLMFYYYSFFLKTFGVGIKSILLGQNILFFLSGIIVYMLLTGFLPGILSCAGAVLFWIAPAFFHTYNHTGGILALLAATWFLALYIKSPRRNHLIGMAFFLAGLNLIYLTNGLCTIPAFFISLCLIDFVKNNKKSIRQIIVSHIFLFASVIFITVFLYLPFVLGLPAEKFKQCFPYMQSNLEFQAGISYLFPAIKTMYQMLLVSCKRYPITLLITVFCIAALLKCLILIFRRDHINFRSDFSLFLTSVGIIAFFNLVTHLISNIPYRIYWSLPHIIIAALLLASALIRNFPQKIKIAVYILFAVFSLCESYLHIQRITSKKDAGHFLPLARAQIYISHPQEWIQTVKSVSNEITANTQKNDKIIPIPYDYLYLFLTDRRSGIYVNSFFKFNLISQQQQEDIIHYIEEENIQWVIFSNRSYSTQSGLGFFGRTHCRLLAEYIDNHYQPAAEYGPWGKEGKWVFNHAVKVLKKFD